MGNVYVFRRKFGVPTPSGGLAGHVGWAFELGAGQGIYCGSTENPDAHPFHFAGDDNGWWGKPVPDENALLNEMRQRKYDDYKRHSALISLPPVARNVADNCRLIGYSFTGNNCLDHTFCILSHYGVLDMPLPFENMCYPNSWFSALPWEEFALGPAAE